MLPQEVVQTNALVATMLILRLTFAYKVLNFNYILVCPNGYYGKNTTTNRTCVTNCGSGQWANLLTNLCITSTLNCPNGHYADTTSNRC